MKIKYILFPCLAISLMACGSGAGNTEQEAADSSQVVRQEIEADYSQMQAVDLSDLGLMASIYAPNEEKGRLSMEESGYGSIILRLGERFGLEVVPFAMGIVEKRNELEQGTVYQIEVIEERKDYMLYRKFIPGSEVLQEYHLYLTKEINGELVAVKTLDDMELKEAQAREVLKSAQSLKAKNPS